MRCRETCCQLRANLFMKTMDHQFTDLQLWQGSRTSSELSARSVTCCCFRVLVCCSLLLLAVVLGCSTSPSRNLSANSDADEPGHGEPPFLYLFFGTGYKDDFRSVYMPIRTRNQFSIHGEEHRLQIRGRVDSNSGKWHADVAGQTSWGGGHYAGAMELDAPVRSQVGASKVRPIWFAISTNSAPTNIVDRINAYWLGSGTSNQVSQ